MSGQKKSGGDGRAAGGGGYAKSGKPRPGTGGYRRDRLEGKGPTPPAHMRPGHPAQRRAEAAAKAAARGTRRAGRPGPPACRVPCLITGAGLPGAPGSAGGTLGGGLGPPLRGMAGAHVRGRGRPLAFEPLAALAAGTRPRLARFRPPAAAGRCAPGHRAARRDAAEDRIIA